ncbi:NDUB7-like protein [Mya arenaria]|uniref:NADH dehydrogenase [ubiquinone] 1 beta subcomplex subunit 7 n=1 Tax=Mya arenaria TaxID=6604 RepID=A0ABY7FQ31_MYAAR|nr:NADH dehydrogenase [ubiquinone] 1 beta subcomplex subunit 7-like [Mya arenaria]XP_052774768.1 NADH dehydrogenase [ubiquinone] 1 beta subcomplex subunit 7-like [Mya arenaria]WAR23142.1 NDUB7-like protein [Mya arenaria]
MGIAKSKFNEYWPDVNENIPSRLEIDIKGPTFDPMLGFPNGRKERVAPLTHEVMVDANIPLKYRDYCSDKYLDWLQCMREESFGRKLFGGVCHPAKHSVEECVYKDTVIRWKEYEREKRLRERRKRRIEKGLEPDPDSTNTEFM